MNFIRLQSARTRLALATAVALALAACGGGGSTTPAPTPNPVPSLTSISPTSATAGAAGFSLTVNGSNFLANSVVRWQGEDRITTFISGTKLTAAVTFRDISDGGTAQVTVFNPAPGGGTSTALTFTIENPTPTLTSLSPTSAIATGPDFALQIKGANFVPSSVVRWNGSGRATALVSSAELTATILASDVASPGTAQVSVFNPTPGGGASGNLEFAITTTAPLALNTSRLPDTTAGKTYHFTLAATGGVPVLVGGVQTYQWSIDAGSLPAGLSLDSATGRISGAVAGSTSNFTIRVTDSATTPNTATRSLTLQVLPSLGRNDFCTSGSAAGTTQISNGTIRASFSPYGDVDVYSFQGTAGARVTIETFAQRLDLDGNPFTRDSQADTILELLDSNCAQLTFDDDLSFDPHIQDSLINFTLPAPGLYFIRVRDFRGDGRPDLIYDLALSGAD